MATRLTKCKSNAPKRGSTRYTLVFLSDANCERNKKYSSEQVPFSLNSNLAEFSWLQDFLSDIERTFNFLVQGTENDSLVFALPQVFTRSNEKIARKHRSIPSKNTEEKKMVTLITNPMLKKQKSSALTKKDFKSTFEQLRGIISCSETTEKLSDIKYCTVQFWGKINKNGEFVSWLEEYNNTIKSISKREKQLLEQKNQQAITEDQSSFQLGRNGLKYRKRRAYEKHTKDATVNDFRKWGSTR